jgi:hypothetical protein
MLQGKYQLFQRDDNRSRHRIDSPAIVDASDLISLKHAENYQIRYESTISLSR